MLGTFGGERNGKRKASLWKNFFFMFFFTLSRQSILTKKGEVLLLFFRRFLFKRYFCVYGLL